MLIDLAVCYLLIETAVYCPPAALTPHLPGQRLSVSLLCHLVTANGLSSSMQPVPWHSFLQRQYAILLQAPQLSKHLCAAKLSGFGPRPQRGSAASSESQPVKEVGDIVCVTFQQLHAVDPHMQTPLQMSLDS